MVQGLGRLLLYVGLGLAAVGVILWAGGRVLPLGRLPGDVILRRGRFTLYFPLATGIVLSLLLTLVLNLLWRIRAR